MPYECQIKELPEYLRVDVTGDWTPGMEFEDAFDVWKQVAEEYRRSETAKILSVWDVPGRLPTMSAYELGAKISSLGVDRTFSLAIVHLSKERLEDSLFAETVAINRGFHIKMFSDEKSALPWLLA